MVQLAAVYALVPSASWPPAATRAPESPFRYAAPCAPGAVVGGSGDRAGPCATRSARARPGSAAMDGPHSQTGSLPFDRTAAAHPVPQFPHLVAIARGVFLAVASLKQLRGRQAGQTVAQGALGAFGPSPTPLGATPLARGEQRVKAGQGTVSPSPLCLRAWREPSGNTLGLPEALSCLHSRARASALGCGRRGQGGGGALTLPVALGPGTAPPCCLVWTPRSCSPRP